MSTTLCSAKSCLKSGARAGPGDLAIASELTKELAKDLICSRNLRLGDENMTNFTALRFRLKSDNFPSSLAKAWMLVSMKLRI